MALAKLFTHGGSQAVRLPKEFRFEGTTVGIRRIGSEVVLSPAPMPDGDELLAAIEAFDTTSPIEREQPATQRREPIRERR